MKIDYVLLNPTRNMTVLVKTPILTEDQPKVAAKLMKIEASAEQVGFVRQEGRENFLRMAGGEFCGNAAMSAAVLRALETGENKFDINVSGSEKPIRVEVKADETGSFECRVDMPKPVSILKQELEFEGKKYTLPIVNFSGISHIVAEEKIDVETAEKAVKCWCKCVGNSALGLMLLDGNKLDPLVYVPEADTLFWESSCASGTSAVGAYLAKKGGKKVELAVAEPGGVLNIEADPEGELVLSGKVSIEYEKVIDI